MKYSVVFCVLSTILACSPPKPEPQTVEPTKTPAVKTTQSPKIAATQTPPKTPDETQKTDTPKIIPIKLNGQVVGRIEQAPKQSTMVWALGEAERTFNLGEDVHAVNALKIVKMNTSQSLSRHGLAWDNLHANHMSNQALLFEVDQRHPPRKNTKQALQRYRIRKFKPETRKRWYVLSLAQPHSMLWRETISYQHGDGFGGYSLWGIELVVKGNTRKIKARRRDQLPARRSRCMAPKPYPVEYTQRQMGFVETTKRPITRSPCGR